MDKQDAIDFIVQEYENGRSPKEIASSLSARMGAPLEVVARFVNRTLEQRQSLLDDLPGSAASTSAATPAPEPPQPPAFTPTWKETIARAPTGTPFAGLEEEAEAEPEPASLPDEIATLRENSLPVDTAGGPGAAQPAAEAIDPRLEKFILDLLIKNGKRTDLIMAVCERAAIDWKEAERLVERVGAAHRKKIISRRNRVLIPFSLGFIAIGLGLAYAGVSEMFALGPLISALLNGGVQAAAQQPPPADFNTRSFWALGLGAALIVGGLIGVIRAMRTDSV